MNIFLESYLLTTEGNLDNDDADDDNLNDNNFLNY